MNSLLRGTPSPSFTPCRGENLTPAPRDSASRFLFLFLVFCSVNYIDELDASVHTVGLARESTVILGSISYSLESCCDIGESLVEYVAYLAETFLVELIHAVIELLCAVFELSYAACEGRHTVVESTYARIELTCSAAERISARAEFEEVLINGISAAAKLCASCEELTETVIKCL